MICPDRNREDCKDSFFGEIVVPEPNALKKASSLLAPPLHAFAKATAVKKAKAARGRKCYLTP